MRFLLVVFGVLLLAGCGPTPEQQKAESDAYMEKLGRDAQQQQLENMRATEGGVFTPKSFPTQMIAANAIVASHDPDNTTVQSISARHNGPDPFDMDFCGRMVRRNSNGYADDPQIFFGNYGNNQVRRIIVGAEAESQCSRRVYAKP